MSQASTTPLPRRTPGAAFADTILGPKPTPPRRPLTAVMPDALRAIDWNGHMPSAPTVAVSMTREQLDRALAEWDEDDDKPVIPKVPGQRKPSPRSNWDTADIYERPAAWNAFGSAA